MRLFDLTANLKRSEFFFVLAAEGQDLLDQVPDPHAGGLYLLEVAVNRGIRFNIEEGPRPVSGR